MRRLIFFLIVLGLLSLGLAWLADRPGEVSLVWFDYKIETSVFTATLLLLALIIALLVIIQSVRAIIHGPEAFRMFWGMRRKNKGLQAVARGLVAVGAWDVKQALKAASSAESLLGTTPLTLLLRSQAAQLSGDQGAARASFEAMLQDPHTRLLGLRGLYIEAQRAGDGVTAADYARAASMVKADLPWASAALLMTQARGEQWDDVILTLKKQQRARLIGKVDERRLRAVALTAKARAELERNRDQARGMALEAARLDPILVPAVTLAAELVAEHGDIKRATRLIEAAWKLKPHPELAHLFTHLRQGDSAKDRLKRARQLTRLQPDSAESRIALATAAAETRDFALALETLKPLSETEPTQRVCLLMARIADAEGDIGAMRGWLDRALRAPRDAVWLADGQVLAAWSPIGPVSGALGAAEWKVPQETPRGALLLQEQLPVIPAPYIESRPASLPLNKPAFKPALSPVQALPATPFLPDDPGSLDDRQDDLA